MNDKGVSGAKDGTNPEGVRYGAYGLHSRMRYVT